MPREFNDKPQQKSHLSHGEDHRHAELSEKTKKKSTSAKASARGNKVEDIGEKMHSVAPRTRTSTLARGTKKSTPTQVKSETHKEPFEHSMGKENLTRSLQVKTEKPKKKIEHKNWFQKIFS